jgi:2-keto-4-pentenoate hydratase/2-oxohepta-3-ene-1,7-dioic acid hydratase in catechol pathway
MAQGRTGYGLVNEDGTLSDCSAVIGGRYPSLRAVIAAQAAPALVDAARAARRVKLDEVALLPPIPLPPRLLCIGKNYGKHAAEMGGEAPTVPNIFLRNPRSFVGHGAPMVKPKLSDAYDFEGELAVVIGRAGRHIPREEALAHVFGYGIFNDGSVRDFQQHSLAAGKNFDSSGAFGPWIVDAASVGDPQALGIVTRLNGETVQNGSTADMIHPVAKLIEFVSGMLALEPGDVLSTGTPDGVGAGRKPPLWMKPGDRIEVTIEKIGTLANPIVAE